MNIIEALEANGVDYKKGSRYGEYRICCPFCPDNRGEMDEDFRFGFNIQTGQGHCFHAGCNASYSEAALHAIIEKLELGELVEIQKKIKEKKKIIIQKIKLPEGYEKLERPGNSDIDGAEHYLRMAYRYAKERGLTYEQIQDKKIGYAECGEFKYRIIFPVVYHRKLYGVVGRDFTGRQKLKYKNSVGTKAIYNIPEQRAEEAVLTEGVFDALAIERAITDWSLDSLALLGASLSEEQLEMLKGYQKFFLWPDPDRGGVKAFLKIAELLKDMGEVFWVMPDFNNPEKDPSEMDKLKIKFKLEQAEDRSFSAEARLKTWMAFEEDLV